MVLGLFLGFLYGAVIGLVLIVTKLRGKSQAVPFGPFLAAGAHHRDPGGRPDPRLVPGQLTGRRFAGRMSGGADGPTGILDRPLRRLSACCVT